VKLVKGDRDGWEALFSDDELHRFTLHRTIDKPVRWLDLAGVMAPRPYNWTASRRLVSCGLNPSTADAFKNDSTVRKELVFGWLWWCQHYTKVNAYAWRDTHPENMFAAQKSGRDIVGFDWTGHPPCGNDEAIRQALISVSRDGGIALAAWGTHVDPNRARRLATLAAEVGVQWMCLGTNQDGSPKHSLYPPYVTKLVPWTP
jgi:hypothetical protein